MLIKLLYLVILCCCYFCSFQPAKALSLSHLTSFTEDMGPRKPEVEYISLRKLRLQKQRGVDAHTKEAYTALEKLANEALKGGPFSITFGKTLPHIAPSGDVRDFLSYAPYWWPENPNNSDSKYVRKDGKRNPDIGCAKDQSQLESLAESLTYLCLGYYLLENENYAIHAVSLIDTFFLNESTRMNANLNYAQFVRGSQNKTKLGRKEGVLSSRGLSRIANLLPLLDSFHGYYALKQSIQLWFQNYLAWLNQSPIALEAKNAKNNIHTWYIVQLVAIEQFLSPVSPQASNVIINFARDKLPKFIDATSGDQPQESNRANPLQYLVFNLQAILFICELGKDLGLNVYKSSNLVYLAVDYIMRFADDPNQDITQAVRCVEIVSNNNRDKYGVYKQFIDAAYHSKFADKIGGRKNAINRLWSVSECN